MIIFKCDLVSIGHAARVYGVSVPTMRRWDREGKLKSHSRTLGNHRRYEFYLTEKLKVGYVSFTRTFRISFKFAQVGRAGSVNAGNKV